MEILSVRMAVCNAAVCSCFPALGHIPNVDITIKIQHTITHVRKRHCSIDHRCV